MKQICLFVVSITVAYVVCPLLSAAPMRQVDSSENYQHQIDEIFREVDSTHSPGCALAVVKDGEVVFAKGYGVANLEYGIPISADTVFHVASVSKQFTAFGIQILASEGKLSLQDPVRKHLPDFPTFDQEIRIRHLMHHTSGLRDQWELLTMAGWRMDDVITQRQIIRLINRQKELNFAPGTRFLYCNSGYTLLSEIVSHVERRPFHEWMDEKVFQPLDMSNTQFYIDHERIVANRAYSYRSIESETGQTHAYKKSVLNFANVGATSLFTSANDLAKWSIHLMEPKIGSQQANEQMFELAKLSLGRRTNYASGLMIGKHRGFRMISHAGSDAGYRSHICVFPDQKLAVIVLSNLASMNAAQKALNVADVYLGNEQSKNATDVSTKAKDQPVETKAEHTKADRVDVNSQDLDTLAGNYQMQGNPVHIIRLTRKDKSLFVKSGQYSQWEFTPIGNDEFYVDEIKKTICFERTPDGHPTGFVFTAKSGAIKFKKIADEKDSEALKKMQELVGEYYSPELDTTYRLVIENGMLVAKHQRNDDQILGPISGDRFAATVLGRIKFERDENGVVTAMRASTGRVINLKFERRN